MVLYRANRELLFELNNIEPRYKIKKDMPVAYPLNEI